METRYKHILWDWNGTLLDDSWLCVEALNILLEEINKPPISLREYRTNFEFPVINFYNYLGFNTKERNFKKISHKFIELYNKRCLSECSLRKGAISTLKKMQSLGLTQYILSAAHFKELNQGLTYFKLTNFFNTIIAAKTIYAEGKISNAKRWIHDNCVNKNDVILIGDTLHDLDVANAIGVDCGLLLEGHCSKEKLNRYHNQIFNDLDSLHDFIIKIK